MRGLSLRERLVARIAAEGPITVADYMDACLHDPEDGYYATRPCLGAEGDFITAPHVSQIFGELLGAWAAEIWMQMGEPARVRLIELGPGDGTMMTDVLRAARAASGFSDAIELVLVETSAPLRKVQAGKLPGARWVEAVEDLDAGSPVVILANEFLDCLPIRQGSGDGRRERRVTAEGGALAFTVEGPIVEWSPAQASLGETLEALIARAGGAALFIDYGGDGVGDTLQAVRGHHREGPLYHPGEADLTARVDFAAFLAAAGEISTFGPVGQGTFLKRLGIEARARRLAAAHSVQADKVARQVERLTKFDQMGELFQVACLASPGLVPPGFW